MTLGHDPDRLIDQALAEAVSGEPRRVNAASVRRALAGPSRSPSPIWLAAAAVLLIAFGVRLRESPPAESANRVASGPTSMPIPGAIANSPSASAIREPEGVVVERRPRGGTASSSRPRVGEGAPPQIAAVEPGFEGLPRLVVPVLDRPVTLVPPELQASALTIAALEIQPLSSPALSIDQDH